MTEKVITINTQPGIRRDGTILDGDQYSDGLWVRFQRGRPRKILGVRKISQQIYGPTRGMFVDSNNGINNIFTSYASGLQVIGVAGSNGKTTCKELIYAVLSKHYVCHATPGNYNNHLIAQPLVFSMPVKH